MSHQGSSIDKQDNVTKRLTCLQEARVAGAAEEEEEEEGCGGTLVDLVMDLVVDLVATVVDLVATVVEGAEEVEEEYLVTDLIFTMTLEEEIWGECIYMYMEIMCIAH